MAFEGKALSADTVLEADPWHAGRKCFVIMPYGERADPVTGHKLDFDAVFERIIRPVVEALDLACIRSDKVSQSGLIHKEMIENIIEADVVIVDVSTGSPNVFFELGIRHTARRAGTVIIRHTGSDTPFNIAGMRALDYAIPGEGGPGDLQVLEDTKALLRTHIRNSLDNRSVDSLVHSLMPGLNVILPDRPVTERRHYVYRLPANGPKPRQLEIITGDLADIDDIDVWVNPENTRMELGRIHDSSVSAHIRYLGSFRDKRGFVKNDAIVKFLRARVGRYYKTGIEPATTVITPPGALARTNNVRFLVHVAAHHGEPGRGYQLIGSYRKCITNSLAAIDAHATRFGAGMSSKTQPRSALIPLFGNRTGGINPHERVHGLVQTAITYLGNYPQSKLERVAFLAFTHADLEQLQTGMQRAGLRASATPRTGAAVKAVV